MYRWFLGLRYLFTRPVHMLGMFGVTVGVWALIVVVSLFSGFLRDIRAHIRSASADIGLYGLPWQTDFAAVERTLLDDPNVASVAPRVVWFGLLHALGKQQELVGEIRAIDMPGAESPFVLLIGIDPVREAAVSGFRSWLDTVEPSIRVDDAERPFAVDGDLPGLLVSARRLAHEFVGRGATVEITSAQSPTGDGSDGQLRAIDARFRIAGAYSTRHFAFDSVATFAAIDVLQQKLAPDAKYRIANEIVLRLKDPTQDAETADRLRRSLGTAHPELGGTRVLTWEQQHEVLLSAIDHQKGLMKLVLFVILVVAGFLIYATLSMMVAEKVNDIGILTALGATRFGVAAVFLVCGTAIAGAGALLGVVLGVLSALNLDAFNRWLDGTFGIDLFPTSIYNLERVPSLIEPWWIVQTCAVAVAVGLLVAALPALRAARHDPLVSLRQTP
jgi:lipoprotein-releasing system permease protein